ncbi:alpha/beta hydrolase family protein [Salinithrix halophila]|uniref:Alpha/beta hydrolase family protein n=1 Tax=Salinithrix halophila TaxID=1485204 RepID=A0ABV8JGN5_9BACL
MKHQTFQLGLGKENRIIRGDVRVPATDRPHPVLILCHGFKGFKDWGMFPYAADTLARIGFAVLTFNFSMNGVGEDPEAFTELEKFAQNTYSRGQEDLTFLLEKITAGELPLAEAMDPERLGIIGHSRGGAESLLFALDESRIQGVALWNSIARLDLFSDNFKAELREKGRAFIPNARTGQNMPINREVLEDLEANRDRFDILGRLPSFNRPLLIIQGDADQAVPVETAESLKERAKQAELHILPGADHTFGTIHPFAGSTPHFNRVLEITSRFFRENFN